MATRRAERPLLSETGILGWRCNTQSAIPPLPRLIGDPAAFALAHFMLANSLYLVGDLDGARIEFEATLQNRSHAQRTSRIYFGFDIVAPARMGLAHTLCQQGYPRQAAEQAHLMLEDALHIEHPATLSILLRLAPSCCSFGSAICKPSRWSSIGISLMPGPIPWSHMCWSDAVSKQCWRSAAATRKMQSISCRAACGSFQWRATG